MKICQICNKEIVSGDVVIVSTSVSLNPVRITDTGNVTLPRLLTAGRHQTNDSDNESLPHQDCAIAELAKFGVTIATTTTFPTTTRNY